MTQFKDLTVGQRFMCARDVHIKVSYDKAVSLDGSGDVSYYGSCVPVELVILDQPEPTKKPPFRPYDLTEGYTLQGAGVIYKSQYYDELSMFDQGNWRATKAGAEKLRDYRAALQRVLEWKHDTCNSWHFLNEATHTIVYNRRARIFEALSLTATHLGTPIGEFTSKEEATVCIRKFPCDLKIIFNI